MLLVQPMKGIHAHSTLLEQPGCSSTCLSYYYKRIMTLSQQIQDGITMYFTYHYEFEDHPFGVVFGLTTNTLERGIDTWNMWEECFFSL